MPEIRCENLGCFYCAGCIDRRGRCVSDHVIMKTDGCGSYTKKESLETCGKNCNCNTEPFFQSSAGCPVHGVISNIWQRKPDRAEG